MSASGTSASSTASAQQPTTSCDMSRRRAVACHAASGAGTAAPRASPGRRDRVMLQMSSARQHVDDERDDEQHQADLDQRVEVESSAASVNSLAMTAAIVYCGAKSDSRDLRRVADHHRHGHRLAERAAEAEHDRRRRCRCARRRAPRGSLPSASRRARRPPRAARCGTAFSTSRATDEVNGMTMTARISAGRRACRRRAAAR